MITLLQSEIFSRWLLELKDREARFAIIARIRRAMLGNFGDHKFLGLGLYEMRINFGPGYRVYYARKERFVYLLLCGGDKASQAKDIEKARAILCQGLE